MGPSTRLTLLLIDDDETARVAVALLAERANYIVRTASSGEEGLRLIAAGLAVDIVLSDVEMPGISGHEVEAALHTCCPVVLMSGSFETSGQGRLARPFTGAQLSQVLQEALLLHAA